MVMVSDDIGRLRQALRGALVGSEFEPQTEALLAAAEPYVLLESFEPEMTADEQAFYLREREASRAGDAARKIDQDRLDAAERTLPLGATRFGFVPDLPPGMAWPTVEGKKLLFFAQIDFSAMPRWEGSPLPADGWLYVFIFFPPKPTKDRPFRTVVLHHRGAREALLRAAQPPADEVWTETPRDPGTYQLLVLTGRLGISVDPARLPQGLSRLAGELEAICIDLRPLGLESPRDWQWCGQLLGQIMVVDGSPLSIVKGLIEHGADAAAQQVAQEPGAPGEDWICLLSIHDGAGTFEWSGAGALYLLIRRRDLAAEDFSRVCMTICGS